jgi:hypothetical protein
LKGRVHGALKIGKTIKELRSIAQECRNADRESTDPELFEFLQEVSQVLNAFADALEEYNQ